MSRRSFLKVAGAGAAGVAVLGAAGCTGLAGGVDLRRLPDEYLPKGGRR